jgi:hypothetical protein
MQRAPARKGSVERSTMLPSARCSADVDGVANRLVASPREAAVVIGFLLARQAAGSAAASFRAALAIMLSTAIVVVNNNLSLKSAARYKECQAGDTI